MVMTDGGNSFDLSDYVRRDVARANANKLKERNGCTDFGQNESYAYTDRTLMDLGYRVDDKGRMLGPRTSTAREYGLANREVSYQK